MLILISCLILFAASLILLVLNITQSNVRYSWLVAIGGAMLALASVFIWLAQLPLEIALPAWRPQTVFTNPILFRADGVSWPYAASIAGLTLAVLLTAVARTVSASPYAWFGVLSLGGLGLLAVTADNPITLLLIWSALDIVELAIQLGAVEGRANNEKVVISFSSRVFGSFILLWANVLSAAQGGAFDFQSIAPGSGMYLVVAAGLRLGVLPLRLPYPAESILRRGLGTSLRLVSAASSLVLLTHIPTGSLSSTITPFLILLALVAALYGGWMWLRAPDELTGRPYWIIGMAALSIIAALNGNPVGAAAWGCALVLAGGALFLASVQHAWLNRILLLCTWSLSSLPFSLTASAWIGSPGLIIPFAVAAQALLITGAARHALRPGERSAFDLRESWINRVYPAGIVLSIFLQLLLGWIGWNGARQIGAWPIALIVSILTVGLVWATPRFRILNPIRAHWVNPASLNTTSVYNNFWAVYRVVEGISRAITTALEGNGGFMWTLFFLVLFVSLLTQGIP